MVNRLAIQFKVITVPIHSRWPASKVCNNPPGVVSLWLSGRVFFEILAQGGAATKVCCVRFTRPSQTKSNQVKPSQTKSNQVKPSQTNCSVGLLFDERRTTTGCGVRLATG